MLEERGRELSAAFSIGTLPRVAGLTKGGLDDHFEKDDKRAPACTLGGVYARWPSG
jgi:hypothetical protein